MTKVTSKVTSETRLRKLDNTNISFYIDLYVVGADQTTITFTALGKAYYGSWFRRFGFTFEGVDANSFFSTVRDISRIVWEQESITEEILATADPQERELWCLWQKGEFEEFSQAFIALAESRKAQGLPTAVSLFARK